MICKALKILPLKVEVSTKPFPIYKKSAPVCGGSASRADIGGFPKFEKNSLLFLLGKAKINEDRIFKKSGCTLYEIQ